MTQEKIRIDGVLDGKNKLFRINRAVSQSYIRAYINGARVCPDASFYISDGHTLIALPEPPAVSDLVAIDALLEDQEHPFYRFDISTSRCWLRSHAQKMFDNLSDEDIDYSDAPVPDLADWVKNAKPFDPTPPNQNGMSESDTTS